jgi:hypothetical protein
MDSDYRFFFIIVEKIYKLVVVVRMKCQDHYELLIRKGEVKLKSYPHNRPWRPIGLRDVKDPTLSRQSVHS